MTWKPDVMIYHSPCDDGFGAAWAAWRKWGDGVEYVPATYGKPAPDVTGKHVLIGDFSFKRAVLDQMAQTAASIVILDHHKTAAEDLAPFAVTLCGKAGLVAKDLPGMFRDLSELGRPPIVALFDMDRSGAAMTWDFCHPGEPVPELIMFIEDRDLWLFENPATRAFSLFLRSMPYEFDVWSTLSRILEQSDTRERLLAEARGIERFYNQKLRELLLNTRTITIDGHRVPAVNAPWAFASDCAHELLTHNPDAPFAACYYDRADGARSYSLRSEDDRIDVAAIARRYGGGGHRNAAGFEVPAP